MTLGRIVTDWSSTTRGDGTTVMHVEADTTTPAGVDAALAAVSNFWSTLATSIPNTYTLQVSQEMVLISEATGDLVDVRNGTTAPAAVPGTYTGDWAAGVGVRIDWRTGAIERGRRVVGRTYVVPIQGLAYSTSGAIDTAIVDGFTGAAEDLRTDLETAGLPLAVWSRPSPAYPVGAYNLAISGSCINKVAVLRNRRD